MNVPLLDLKAQYATLKQQLDDAVLAVAQSQWFILGPEVEKMEREMAQFLEVEHALGVSSGTDALLLALMAIGVGPGDEVIVPTYSFFATAGVVSRLHARPVLVDIDPVTWNIDPAKIPEAITERTKAVVPVHLYGQSADMNGVMAAVEGTGVAVIEDAAQSIGVRYADGRRTGSIGTAGCYSFFPSKNLGGFGDGGLITTNDSELYQRMRIMRVHGGERRYYHSVIGGNFRIDELQSAVLNVKLPYLDGWSRKRAENAHSYNGLFVAAGLGANPANGYAGLTDEHPVGLPVEVYRESGVEFHHIYNQYVIRVKDRAGLREKLAEANIGNEIYYPVPFHMQECFADLGYKPGDFPNAEQAAEEVLALPVYPELSSEQIEYVVDTIADFYRK